MYPTRFHRGRWAGLTVTTVAALLRCNRKKASRLLYELQQELGRPPTLEDIGDMILTERWDEQRDLYLSEIALRLKIPEDEFLKLCRLA